MSSHGFRVKTTHTLLQPIAPVPQNQSDILDYFNSDEKKTNLLNTNNYFNTQPENNQDNRPKGGSGGGMAIRTVASGQPDHM